MGFIVQEFTFIFVAIGIPLHAVAVPGVFVPLALENASFTVDHDS